jgi:hypothetical protein
MSVAETGTSLLVNGRDTCQECDWNENTNKTLHARVKPSQSPVFPTGMCGSAEESSSGNCMAVKRTSGDDTKRKLICHNFAFERRMYERGLGLRVVARGPAESAT